MWIVIGLGKTTNANNLSFVTRNTRLTHTHNQPFACCATPLVRVLLPQPPNPCHVHVFVLFLAVFLPSRIVIYICWPRLGRLIYQTIATNEWEKFNSQTFIIRNWINQFEWIRIPLAMAVWQQQTDAALMCDGRKNEKKKINEKTIMAYFCWKILYEFGPFDGV